MKSRQFPIKKHARSLFYAGAAVTLSSAAWAQDRQQPEEMTDILDIKPLLELPPDWTWLYYGAGLLVLIILAVLIFLYIRKLKNKPPVTEIIPPEKTALKGLDELENADNLQARVFYFRLSEIFRTYIEKRFAVKAMEMTTEELTPVLDELEIDRDLIIRVKNLSREADPVKFAGFGAAPEKMKKDLVIIRELVIETSRESEDAPV